MTDEMVSVCGFSICSFSNDSRQFIIPQELDIHPSRIWDELSDLYRISIGKTNCTEDETAMYKPFFDVLDSKMPFVSHLHFFVNGNELIFTMAYITKTVHSSGIFYDIEATIQDIKYKKG